tara:strand:- start:14072 stop:14560 length:489 start_codon:yes stop_codon:yes gene_type:complete
MAIKILNIVAKDHNKWLRIVKSFGLNEEAEDLVQDMYLKINSWNGKYDKTLMFNETEVNHYFIFRVLRNMFLDKCKKKKVEVSFPEFYDVSGNVSSFEYIEQLDVIQEEIKSWHLYDRKIYELIYIEGYSMLELSKLTGIDYYSIYRTKNKIEKLLNEKIQK